jgi:hypothetical protein
MPNRPQPSRRAVNAMLAAAAPLIAGSAAQAAPAPFRVDIPQARIDRILARVRDTAWPDRLSAPDLRYGVSWDYMRDLARYWTTQYD